MIDLVTAVWWFVSKQFAPWTLFYRRKAINCILLFINTQSVIKYVHNSSALDNINHMLETSEWSLSGAGHNWAVTPASGHHCSTWHWSPPPLATSISIRILSHKPRIEFPWSIINIYSTKCQSQMDKVSCFMITVISHHDDNLLSNIWIQSPICLFEGIMPSTLGKIEPFINLLWFQKNKYFTVNNQNWETFLTEV